MTLTRDTLRRELNDAQERCLDRISKKDPDAKVTGWFDGVTRKGPIVLLSSGAQKLVNNSGYAISYP